MSQAAVVMLVARPVEARVADRACGSSITCRPRASVGARIGDRISGPGGRIDVVWLWRPRSPIPGIADPLPVAGFEVESSWRTRKQIKGDLINLQDLACAFGVIVLLGEGDDVVSTRRFASQLVDRPGCRIVVWSEADLEELAGGSIPADVEFAVASVAPPVMSVSAAERNPAPSTEHAGKYTFEREL